MLLTYFSFKMGVDVEPVVQRADPGRQQPGPDRRRGRRNRDRDDQRSSNPTTRHRSSSGEHIKEQKIF